MATSEENVELGRYDIRLVAANQLARVGSGDTPLHPIAKYTEDESKVYVLTADGTYDLFDKQEIMDGYQKYIKAQMT